MEFDFFDVFERNIHYVFFVISPKKKKYSIKNFNFGFGVELLQEGDGHSKIQGY